MVYFALTLQNDPPWYLSAAKYAIYMLIFCITTGTSELLLITSFDC